MTLRCSVWGLRKAFEYQYGHEVHKETTKGTTSVEKANVVLFVVLGVLCGLILVPHSSSAQSIVDCPSKPDFRHEFSNNKINIQRIQLTQQSEEISSSFFKASG